MTLPALLSAGFSAVVDHVVDYQLLQLPSGLFPLWPFWKYVWVWWQLSCDDLVDFIGSVQSVLLLENEENMGMRKPSLLELHHIHIASSSAHDLGVDEVIHQLLSLQTEHPGHNVRPVLWLLVGEERVCDFRPMRVASECDEEVRLVVLPCNGYCILEVLVHVSWASGEGWW